MNAHKLAEEAMQGHHELNELADAIATIYKEHKDVFVMTGLGIVFAIHDQANGKLTQLILGSPESVSASLNDIDDAIQQGDAIRMLYEDIDESIDEGIKNEGIKNEGIKNA